MEGPRGVIVVVSSADAEGDGARSNIVVEAAALRGAALRKEKKELVCTLADASVPGVLVDTSMRSVEMSSAVAAAGGESAAPGVPLVAATIGGAPLGVDIFSHDAVAEATARWRSFYGAPQPQMTEGTVLDNMGNVLSFVHPHNTRHVRFNLPDDVHIHVQKGTYADIYQAVQAEEPTAESYLVRRIMDSGASVGMTSNVESLDPMSIRSSHQQNIRIQGFNGAVESTSVIGLNAEGFKSALLGSDQMPLDLELLCARDYASLGAVVLHADGGSVLKLDGQQRQRFLKYIARLQEVLRLKVNRNVYEVDATRNASLPATTTALQPLEVQDEQEDAYFTEDAFVADCQESADRETSTIDAAYSSIYTLGRVHYEDTDSRIYGLLLSGLSFSTLRQAAQHKSLLGLHPTVTAQTLRRFEKRHGRTPDLLAKANYDQVPHYQSFEKEEVLLQRPGQHLLCDTFFCDFNETSLRKKSVATPTSEEEPLLEEFKRVAKLPTWGGAIAMNLTVCAYTGFVHGFLIMPHVTALQIVTQALDSFATGLRCTTEIFSADEGIVSDSKFHVYTPPVRQLLLSRHIRFQKALPYNHSIGLSRGELTGRYVKRIQRLAYHIGISNPGIKRLGYTQLDIKKCWGETFYLAVILLLTRPAWNDRSQTRYEAALGRKFNMQTIPLLPIFSIILAWHPSDKCYVHCLYVGPAWRGLVEEPTPGAIRAMYKRGVSTPSIFITAGYKCVTSGAHIDTERAMQRSTERLLLDVTETREQSTAPSAPAAGSVGGATRVEQDTEHIEGASGDAVGSSVQAAVTDDGVETTAEVAPSADVDDRAASHGYYDTDVYDGVPDMSSDDGSHDGDQMTTQVVTSHKAGRRRVSRRRHTRGVHVDQRSGVQSHLLEQQRAVTGAVHQQSTKRSNIIKSGVQHYSKTYKPNTRAERYSRRDGAVKDSMFAYEEYCEHHDPDGEYSLYLESLFADWSNPSDSLYYNFEQDTFMRVMEFGYKAVTEGVPRTWSEALRHPLWGDAARLEKDTLLEKSMVLVPRDVAIEAMKSGAEIVNLFPVYEEKVKEGKTVYKVRLVGDGRQQKHAGDTYSETPSRDEFRIFMHLVGYHNWDFYHCDEKRAFLNAPFIGDTPVYARLGPEYFKVIGALYGLKASPRHYQTEVIARLTSLCFRRLGMCSCIYVKYVYHQFVMVFDYVDDFIWTGSDSNTTENVIEEFRLRAITTPVIKNPSTVLGMNIARNWENRTIHLSMSNKIDELYSKLDATFMDTYHVSMREPRVPLSANNVYIDEEVYTTGTLKDTDDARLLSHSETLQYLSLIGGLLWQIGIRWDILFSVLYLTWFTHQPRVHHMKMAARVILYLHHTRDLQLILGGVDKLEIITTSDATLNTAPKGRSVIAFATRLGKRAGLVSAKCRASIAVLLSSFESELHGVDKAVQQGEDIKLCLTDITEAFKQAAGVSNMVTEMGDRALSITVYSDNKAMVEYVNGKGQAKGVKHALLRLWYLREQVMKGINLEWVEGKTILANPMTKAVHQLEHDAHKLDVQGYHLLD